MTVLRVCLIAAALLLLAMLAVALLALAETRQRITALEAERSLAETRHGPIEYASWGKGAPVLVVHGAGGGFDQGRILAQAIGGDGYRWISVSRFGYLGSALPETPSTAAQAEAFADLLDTLNIGRVSILTMSGGVPPSLQFAAMYPERVDRMMLLSPAPFTPFSPEVEDRPIPTWAYSALLGNDVIYWTLTKVARHHLEAAFDARADLREGLSDEEVLFVRDLVDTFLPASRRLAGVSNEGAAVDPSATYNLEAIRARVLIVHARDDRLNPFAVGSTLAARIPQSRFLPLDHGGHLLLGHHPDLRREFESLLAE
ncbi:alpha/beta hydrolase [Hyphomonas oceanitis]|uniref:alpha/beta fold hydrolase n=1 Tax=Hyphomonas oceanitis TaxID=81033 RepID=UPI0030037372